jgi:geranylgeranyl diphosphate synthase type I
VGDIAMVMADRTMGGAGPAARAVWDDLRTELNMGQYLDVLGTVQGGVSADQARTIMRNKTAGYTIVRPLQLGAALAGRTDLHGALASHGMPLGIAFQLRDDMLGAFGDSTRTGKPVGDDLREGKPTVLLARAVEGADEAQRSVLARVGSPMDDGDVAAIQQVMVDTGAAAACEAEIDTLLGEATAALADLPDVHGSGDALTALADYVAERDT